jgi:hypothetical protein
VEKNWGGIIGHFYIVVDFIPPHLKVVGPKVVGPNSEAATIASCNFIAHTCSIAYLPLQTL